jgi:hypothetical protein
MSVNARVVLLVEDDMTLYTMYQRKVRLSHYWKFDEPFGVRFHFENFWREPMSVNVKVVLLVGVRQDYVHAYQ